jgi:hypothetical protein
MQFHQWLLNEDQSQRAYHVTIAKNLPEIEEAGLVPNYGPANWQGYGGHTKGRNFFSGDLQGAKYWVGKLQDIIDTQYEPAAWSENNFVNEMAIPIIIRFRFNRNHGSMRWADDEHGNDGNPAQGSYYTDRAIPYHESTMQFWDGQTWRVDFDADYVNPYYSLRKKPHTLTTTKGRTFQKKQGFIGNGKNLILCHRLVDVYCGIHTSLFIDQMSVKPESLLLY